MLWKIIEKEMLEQLLSLRLILTFLLVIVLMGADGLIFQRNYQNQLEDYSRNVNRNLELLAQRAAAEPAAHDLQLRRPDHLPATESARIRRRRA